MIIVMAYTALGSLHVTVTGRELDDPLNPFAAKQQRSLHYSTYPVEEVASPDDLCRILQGAIQQADGYAGDLMEQVLN